MPDIAINRVRAKVGFVSENTAKITVVTFNDGAVVARISGGGVASVGARTARGTSITADYPAFTHVCHTGIVTFTGLSPNSRYEWQLEHAGEVISGSFWTPPTSGYAVVVTTCESNEGKVVPGFWGRLREFVENHSPRVIARSHIDDIWYFDSQRIQNTTNVSACPETGLQQVGVPQDSQREHDYVMAWAAYFGMFEQWMPFTNNPDRQWLMRNLANWDMFGDHEFYGNARSEVSDGTATALGVVPAIDAFAGVLFEAFVGDAGPPKIRVGEHYWGMTVGGVTWAALDRVTHCLPYNACNAGNTFSFGAADSGWYETLNGSQPDTDPSLSDLGLPDNQPTEDYLGQTQVLDLIAFFTGSNAPFKCMLSSLAINAHNQPWYDWKPDEWVQFITGIYGSANCDGSAGKHYFHIVGDVHSPYAKKFVANGSTGLGLTAIASGELWEFNTGTVNGSSIGGLNLPMAQGGKILQSLTHLTTTGDRGDGVFAVVDVDPEYIDVTLMFSHTLRPFVGPYRMRVNDVGNAFTPVRSTSRVAGS